jgi:hypothetical protein
VLAVSEDEHISGYTERKGALRHQVAEAGEEALMLFAADKISKARELHLEAQRSRRARRSSKRRLAYYKHCLELLRERLPESRLVDQLDAELAWH